MTPLSPLYPITVLILALSSHALTPLSWPIAGVVGGASQDETRNVRPDISRDDITPLSPSAVSYFKPYTWYTSAAYCLPNTTLTWKCGDNCEANPTFIPKASGGDGEMVQPWYVGFDPTLKEVIVGHGPGDGILPFLRDIDIILRPLNDALFPGVGSPIFVHDGFATAHEKSAQDVLTAVQNTISTHNADMITVVGHSLGGAIALLESVFLNLHIPNATVRTIVYGLPRVGNQEFASYVDAHVNVTHIGNKLDPVPDLPPSLPPYLPYRQTSGEVHIMEDGIWVSCPGQDNPSTQCTAGAVNFMHNNATDHPGPYDGVLLRC